MTTKRTKEPTPETPEQRADGLAHELASVRKRRDDLAAELAAKDARVRELSEARVSLLTDGRTDDKTKERLRVLRLEVAEAEDDGFVIRGALAKLEDQSAVLEREAEAARRDVMRAKLSAMEPQEKEAAANLQAALVALAQAAKRADELQAEVDAHRRALDLPVARIDATTNATLAGLVRLGVIDSRALNVPADLLRRLDPVTEGERQRRAALEAEAAERSELARRPAALRYERGRVEAKLDEWRGVLQKDRSRHAAQRVSEEEARLAEIDAELAELEPTKAETLAAELRQAAASDEIAPEDSWRVEAVA